MTDTIERLKMHEEIYIECLKDTRNQETNLKLTFFRVKTRRLLLCSQNPSYLLDLKVKKSDDPTQNVLPALQLFSLVCFKTLLF